jgi:hypothetical protein
MQIFLSARFQFGRSAAAAAKNGGAREGGNQGSSVGSRSRWLRHVKRTRRASQRNELSSIPGFGNERDYCGQERMARKGSGRLPASASLDDAHGRSALRFLCRQERQHVIRKKGPSSSKWNVQLPSLYLVLLHISCTLQTTYKYVKAQPPPGALWPLRRHIYQQKKDKA